MSQVKVSCRELNEVFMRFRKDPSVDKVAKAFNVELIQPAVAKGRSEVMMDDESQMYKAFKYLQELMQEEKEREAQEIEAKGEKSEVE